MAEVPYSGVPTQEADLNAPDDIQHIEATPASFGAQIGEGLQEAGSKVMDLSNFYGQVAADNATNNFLEGKQKILYGDLSKPAVGEDGQPVTGPDGKSPVGTGGFYALRGADAMNAAKGVQEQMDELIAEQREGLRSPRERLQFDTETRRYRAAEMEGIGRFTDQQQKLWMDTVADQGIDVAKNHIATNLGNPAALDEARENMRDAYVRKAQLRAGNSPEIHDNALAEADREFFRTKISANLITHPLDALKDWQDNQAILGADPHDYELGREASARAQDYMVGFYSDPSRAPRGGLGDGGAVAPQGPVTKDKLHQAFSGQESGGNPNVATSDRRAHGQYQITPDTFSKWAEPGERIDNHADNAAVGQRMLDSYYDRYGGDVARVAVAYFSGPANVAPAGSPTPWLHNRTDGHVSVSTYVAGIEKRLGGTPGGTPYEVASGGEAPGPTDASAPVRGTQETYLADVRAQARAVFGDDPNAVENVVKRTESNIHRDTASDTAALEQKARDSVSFLESGGDPSKVTLTPAQIRAAIPGQRGENLAGNLEMATDYNGAVKKVATATPQQVHDILAGHVPTGPDGFEIADREFAALQKAAQARQEALFGKGDKPGDPAAYALSAFPDVGAAGQAAFQPGASPQALDTYVKKLVGAYGVLGVPAESQSILPNTLAHGIVSSLLMRPPAEAHEQLAKLQQEAGTHWPALYRDLAKAGLPAGMQMAIVVGSGPTPNDAQIMISAMQRDTAAKNAGKDTMDKEAEGLTFNGKSVKEIVNRALSKDPDLTSLRATYGVAGRAGVDQFAGVQAAVRQTALYLYTSGTEHDPAVAAARAAKMVTSLYDFVPQGSHVPVRLPKGEAANFRAVANAALVNLKAGDIQPYKVETDQAGHPLNIPQAERAQHALDGARHAYWVTVPGPDGQGAMLAFDPVSRLPVIRSNGQPLQFSFSHLPALAQQVRGPSLFPAADRAIGQGEAWLGSLIGQH